MVLMTMLIVFWRRYKKVNLKVQVIVVPKQVSIEPDTIKHVLIRPDVVVVESCFWSVAGGQDRVVVSGFEGTGLDGNHAAPPAASKPKGSNTHFGHTVLNS